MASEVIINERVAELDILSKNGNLLKVRVDDKVYDIDIVMVEKGVYSMLLNGISYNIELIKEQTQKKYTVNTLYSSYDVEIVDAESKYLKRSHKESSDEENVISTPMPGKIVKVLVKEGDNVKAGETVIVVSAMKMESEYKVKKDRLIKKILVKEGDTVDGNQPLVIIE